MKIVLILTALSLSGLLGTHAAVPGDCTPLEAHVIDAFDPRGTFGTNSELNQKQPPRRTGNLRSQGTLPTHHFATSQLKKTPEPMVLWPYFSTMDQEGIVYDPFEFQRFWDPDRSIVADQQSAWVNGEPWNRLLDLGTNMFQKVSGPDGNPLANFNGQSGVKIGIDGAGEPELKDFGDLYANFMYNGNGGSMEVPLVRGSSLLTHIFKNANPVIRPYCLTAINGQQQTFDCPTVPAAGAGGTGYLSGTCSGSTLHILLHNTRPIHDVTKLQYAVSSAGQWSSNHGMRNCDASTCHLQDGGKTVQINVPNSAGQMNFALNYIGHYVLPWNWVDKPQSVLCGAGKKRSTEERSLNEISVTASCDSARNTELRVHFGSNHFPGLNKVQYALETSSHWSNPPPMRTCSTTYCHLEGNTLVIKRHMLGTSVKFAINVIGWLTLPHTYWIEHPYTMTCGSQATQPPHTNAPVHTQPPVVTQAPHTQATHTNVPHTNAPHTQAPQTGGTHTVSLNPGQKFVLELKEPGEDAPGQTRKFVLYFSEPVTPHSHGNNALTFSPNAGGHYNGIVQLGYLGSGPSGSHANDTAMDQHAGVFSYKPTTSYCVSESNNKAYVTFNWNPDTRGAVSQHNSLMMIAMPHHKLSLQKTLSVNLHNTPFGFTGMDGPIWVLEMDLPRASMLPDNEAVQKVISLGKQSEMVDAIGRDASNQNLDAICSHSDSYNVGKAIGMVARLASISRAFNTNHYQALDTSIKNCLEKWLRITDTLDNMWKFHYDLVWGGLFLRATNGDLNFGVDYGFPYYNDHHFHLGYFIYAMAYYTQYHSSWGQTHRHRIMSIVRDVSNLSPKDQYFPVARQKDIYTGFSWATGLVPGTRQEESSSESINCYHGVAALGDAMNDATVKHTGQVLLAMELMSVREYWQVRQHNRQHFPPMIQETGVVGQIAEDSFYVYTLDWPCDPNKFPMRHACLVGIQIIPITSVSKYWVDKEWAGSIKDSCTHAIHPDTDPNYSRADPTDMRALNTGWAAFCHAAMAPLDSAHQTAAANYVKDKRPQDLVGGTGAASTLLFIYGNS